jgi:hypothetical protein
MKMPLAAAQRVADTGDQSKGREAARPRYTPDAGGARR